MWNQLWSPLTEGKTFGRARGPQRMCAAPGCRNTIDRLWDETGRYCGNCAMEMDLFDRARRQACAFPVDRRKNGET